MLHPYFVFANVLAVAYRYICVFHFEKKKLSKFLVNKMYLLADKHFNCSSDESRSKHPDCVFL